MNYVILVVLVWLFPVWSYLPLFIVGYSPYLFYSSSSSHHHRNFLMLGSVMVVVTPFEYSDPITIGPINKLILSSFSPPLSRSLHYRMFVFVFLKSRSPLHNSKRRMEYCTGCGNVLQVVLWDSHPYSTIRDSHHYYYCWYNPWPTHNTHILINIVMIFTPARHYYSYSDQHYCWYLPLALHYSYYGHDYCW
jgi:hypothetical protein